MAEARAGAGTGWWSRFAHDLSLRIQHRGFLLTYLIFERGLKGLVLLAFTGYIALHPPGGLDRPVRFLVSELNLSPGSGFLGGLAYRVLRQFGSVPEESLEAIAVGAFIYGAIELSEAVGLILRRRWAEYLVVLATAFFIPLEMREALLRVTALRIATLLVNVVVVVYLVRKKRLFRFDEAEADA